MPSIVLVTPNPSEPVKSVLWLSAVTLTTFANADPFQFVFKVTVAQGVIKVPDDLEPHSDTYPA